MTDLSNRMISAPEGSSEEDYIWVIERLQKHFNANLGYLLFHEAGEIRGLWSPDLKGADHATLDGLIRFALNEPILSGSTARFTLFGIPKLMKQKFSALNLRSFHRVSDPLDPSRRLEIGLASTVFEMRWNRSDRVFLKNVLSLLKDSLIQRRYMDQLFRQATVDALTGLSNRRFFLDHLENEMHRHQRFHFEAGMLMLDLDHFKNVNDTYGHDCGDEVLKDFAHKAKSCLREVDVFGRLGGEEFAILLPVTDKNGAMVVAERIRKTIEEGQVLLNGQAFKYTVSIGVTLLINGESKEDLLKRADQAMYEAKMSGRNRVHLWDTTIKERN